MRSLLLVEDSEGELTTPLLDLGGEIMANIKITGKCPQCGGDGVRSLPDASVQPPTFNDIPCTTCNSTGILDTFEMDSTTIDDIVTKVDYVYSKTDNIITKLNNIKDKVDQIWDKVNI